MRKRTLVLPIILLLAFSSLWVAAAQEATPEATAEATASPSNGETTEAVVAEGIAAAPSENNSLLRVAHFAPDAPTVDIYFNDTLAISGLSYTAASPWIPVEPATYSVTVVPAGSAPADAVAGPFDISASAGSWQTVAVVGSAEAGTLNAAIISEDYQDLLPGTGGFTFFHALEGAPAVNLVRNDVVYYAQIGYAGENPEASFSSLRDDTGLFNVQVVNADDPANVITGQTELEIPENGYSLLALVGTPENPALIEIVTDESEVAIVRGLLPEPGTLVEALRTDENLSGFADALGGSALLEQLSDPEAEYTIFAPASFVMDDTAVSGSGLESYIVEGKYTSNDIMEIGSFTALDGTALEVTTGEGGIYVNGVLVIDVNIAATNGVVHMINGTFAPAE